MLSDFRFNVVFSSCIPYSTVSGEEHIFCLGGLNFLLSLLCMYVFLFVIFTVKEVCKEAL